MVLKYPKHVSKEGKVFANCGHADWLKLKDDDQGPRVVQLSIENDYNSCYDFVVQITLHIFKFNAANLTFFEEIRHACE